MKSLIAILVAGSIVWAGVMEDGNLFYEKKDYKNALMAYKKAASQNDVRAFMQIAGMYYQGQGVGEDPKLAFEWYLKAAKKEEPLAMFIVGLMYEEGKGVENTDFAKALEWYKKASDKGFSAAMIKVGLFYIDGTAGKQDLKEAKIWINKAYEAGNEQAKLFWDKYELYKY